MPTIEPARLDDQSPQGELLREHKERVSGCPNFFGTLANSPATFNSYLNGTAALGSGVLPAALTVQIALTVSSEIGTPYCVKAHKNIAEKNGVSAQEYDLNISGISSDRKTGLILEFVRKLIRHLGKIKASEIELLRAQGVTDEELLEIIGHTVTNLGSSMLNHIAGTELESD